MKLKYTTSEGEDVSHAMAHVASDKNAELLKQLPVKAAGMALIGLCCPNHLVGMDFINIQGDDSHIKVVFGTERCKDQIEATFA